MNWESRAAIFLKAAELISGPYRQILNAVTMLGQSKNAFQAEIDCVCELADFYRFNVKNMYDLYHMQPNSSAGIWDRTVWRPLEGFVFALTPFNFTSIAGNLPGAPALMGNVCVWKPSKTAVYSAYIVMKILQEAGLPDGVINLVYCSGPTASDVIFSNKDFAGIHFTGSTGVFNDIWATIVKNIGKYRSYPRIVGETGGKDYVFADPTAKALPVATALIRGAFEYQGQKCSAASRAYIPSNIWPEVKALMQADLNKIKNDADNPMPMPIPEGAFAEEERYMINGVLTLASRSLRGIMTPRGEISWVDANLGVDEIREQLLSSPHSLFPVCRGELDEIIGIVRAKELLVALEDGVDVAAIASASPAIVVPETLDPINLLGVLRRARGSFVIVTNEFGVVQGLVTPLDVLEAIAGEFPDADETPEIIADAGGWLVKGGTDLHALQQALDVDTLVNEDEDIATVAGLVIAANGHIPRVGDVIEVAPLSITIVEANDYRVDLVRIVKEQPAHDEDE